MGYTQCDGCVAEVSIRALLGTVNTGPVTVMLGCPSSAHALPRCFLLVAAGESDGPPWLQLTFNVPHEEVPLEYRRPRPRVGCGAIPE